MPCYYLSSRSKLSLHAQMASTSMHLHTRTRHARTPRCSTRALHAHAASTEMLRRARWPRVYLAWAANTRTVPRRKSARRAHAASLPATRPQVLRYALHRAPPVRLSRGSNANRAHLVPFTLGRLLCRPSALHALRGSSRRTSDSRHVAAAQRESTSYLYGSLRACTCYPTADRASMA